MPDIKDADIAELFQLTAKLDEAFVGHTPQTIVQALMLVPRHRVT